MHRRLMILLGLMPALAPVAVAADDSSAGFQTNLAEDGARTISKSLGKGYSVGGGGRLTPYLELGTQSWGSKTFGVFLPSGDETTGRVLLGGMARYALAPHWTISFDLAAGIPLQTESGDHSRLAGEDRDGDEPVWRLGGKIGYTLNKNFSAFTAVEIGTSQIGPPPSLAQFVPPAAEFQTSLRFGLTYRFP